LADFGLAGAKKAAQMMSAAAGSELMLVV